VVSSRPSDAIALAVRVGAPVYASEDVLDEAGAVLQEGPLPDEPEEAIEEAVEEFREFLEQLNPADFQGSPPRAPGESRAEPLADTSESDASDEADTDEDAVLWADGGHDHESNGDTAPDETGLDDDEDGDNGPPPKPV
jgi:hypothetical protein